MVDSGNKRILREFENLQKNKTENKIIVWMDNNIRHWKGIIKGPVLKISNIFILYR